jgi:hypothetical protein
MLRERNVLRGCKESSSAKMRHSLGHRGPGSTVTMLNARKLAVEDAKEVADGND